MVAGILDKISHERAGGDDGLLGLWIDGSKGWEGMVFGLDKDTWIWSRRGFPIRLARQISISAARVRDFGLK